MDPIEALLKFVSKLLPFLPLPTEDQVLKLLSTEGNAALKARFKAKAGAVRARLTENHWFPLPSTRVPEGRCHTLVSSTLYYVAQEAVSEHGLDNLVAGGIQGFYMLPILAAVDPTAYNVAGREDALIAAVGSALADLICPASPTPTPTPAPTPAPAPTNGA